MSVQPGPLLAALNGADIPYVVIGGFAVIANGVVRTTEDLGVLTPATPANGARIASVLAELGRTEARSKTSSLMASITSVRSHHTGCSTSSPKARAHSRTPRSPAPHTPS